MTSASKIKQRLEKTSQFFTIVHNNTVTNIAFKRCLDVADSIGAYVHSSDNVINLKKSLLEHHGKIPVINKPTQDTYLLGALLSVEREIEKYRISTDCANDVNDNHVLLVVQGILQEIFTFPTQISSTMITNLMNTIQLLLNTDLIVTEANAEPIKNIYLSLYAALTVVSVEINELHTNLPLYQRVLLSAFMNVEKIHKCITGKKMNGKQADMSESLLDKTEKRLQQLEQKQMATQQIIQSGSDLKETLKSIKKNGDSQRSDIEFRS